MIYGYIYTEGKEEETQQKYVFSGLSIPDENIYIDYYCENDKERRMLYRMVRKLKADDLVYVKSLSWLGNSYEEIREQWRTLTKKQKADVVVLDMPLVDTRQGKEFMGTLVSDVVTEMLTFSEEYEYSKNRKRSTKSYQAAKAKGVQYGRPMKPLPDNFEPIYQRWKAGEITGSVAAAECGMPLSTFRWRAKRYEEG